jgi:hypothetical protein
MGTAPGPTKTHDPIADAFDTANAALYGYKSVLLNKAATAAQILLLTSTWQTAKANFDRVLNDPTTPEVGMTRDEARRWLR